MKFPIVVVLVCVMSYFIFLFRPSLPKTEEEVRIEEADKIFIGALSDGLSYEVIPQDSSLRYSLPYYRVKRDCTALFTLEYARGFAYMIDEMRRRKK